MADRTDQDLGSLSNLLIIATNLLNRHSHHEYDHKRIHSVNNKDADRRIETYIKISKVQCREFVEAMRAALPQELVDMVWTFMIGLDMPDFECIYRLQSFYKSFEEYLHTSTSPKSLPEHWKSEYLVEDAHDDLAETFYRIMGITVGSTTVLPVFLYRPVFGKSLPMNLITKLNLVLEDNLYQSNIDLEIDREYREKHGLAKKAKDHLAATGRLLGASKPLSLSFQLQCTLGWIDVSETVKEAAMESLSKILLPIFRRLYNKGHIMSAKPWVELVAGDNAWRSGTAVMHHNRYLLLNLIIEKAKELPKPTTELPKPALPLTFLRMQPGAEYRWGFFEDYEYELDEEESTACTTIKELARERDLL